jgi:hypothetical protein
MRIVVAETTLELLLWAAIAARWYAANRSEVGVHGHQGNAGALASYLRFAFLFGLSQSRLK